MRFYQITKALLCVLLLMSGASHSEETRQIEVGDHQNSGGPRQLAPVFLPLEFTAAGFNVTRTIPVQRQDGLTRKSVGDYSHAPIFAFTERSEPLVIMPDEGESGEAIELPRIFHQVMPGDNEVLLLTVEMVLSTPDFRELARLAVVGQDGDIIRKSGGNDGDVSVSPWPTYQVFLYCLKFGSDLPIAFGKTRDNISREGDRIRLPIEIDPTRLEEFCQLVKNEQLEFLFYYRGSEKEINYGNAETRGTINIADIVERLLTAEQINGSAVITRSDMDRVLRAISASSQTVIRGDKDTIAVLQSNGIGTLRDSLFASFDYDTYSANMENQSATANALDDLIRPRQHYRVFTRGQENAESNIKMRDVTDSGQLNTGFSMNGFSIGTTGKKTIKKGVSDSKTVVNSEKESNGESGFDDYNAQVYKLKDGWKTVELNDSVQVFLTVGNDKSFREDSPIPTTFTESILNQQLQALTDELKRK